MLGRFKLFSDMPGFQAPHGGTIPPHILVTNLRPDLFLIDETARIAIVFELTCPWDNNIDRNHSYKEDKYLPLVADLSRTFKTYQFSVEVSARGQVTKPNRARLNSVAYKCWMNTHEIYTYCKPFKKKMGCLGKKWIA